MVSIIITTYGGSIKLKRAINSVLGQTYKDIEIIVVDDNNPETYAREKTESIMREFSYRDNVIYLKHQRNLNGATARNTGINIAKGEYIAFLDDDDIYLKDRVQVSVEMLEKNRNICGICLGVVCLDGKSISSIIRKQNGEKISVETLLLSQNEIGTGSNIFVRRDIVEKIGGFDTDFERFQDIEFMIRISANGSVVFHNNILIIKDASDARNPQYNSVRKAFTLFNEKFDKEINLLSSDNINSYFIDRCKYLYILAKISGNKKNIEEAGNELQKYKSLSKRENIETEMAIVTAIVWKIKNKIKYGFLYFVYKKLKAKKMKKVDAYHKKILGKEKYEDIKKYYEI